MQIWVAWCQKKLKVLNDDKVFFSVRISQITKHSGPSMNSRFRKNLKFNLHLYPIPLKDKLKLNPHYEGRHELCCFM